MSQMDFVVTRDIMSHRPWRTETSCRTEGTGYAGLAAKYNKTLD